MTTAIAATIDAKTPITEISIGLFVESKLNPRRRFEGLDELAASLKSHGVLVPLLVRPSTWKHIDNHEPVEYEILAGARRFRAAGTAGLKSLPARVVELDDAAALELAIIDNLQRADVHPLDEGVGYRKLMETAQLTIEEIAQRVNKSASYVYQRLKLADLTAPAQKSFIEGEFSASHAILIARLTPKQQAVALKRLKRREGEMSVRELAEEIEREFALDLLSRAPFDLKDAQLLASAGSCQACPKRTGNDPRAWPEIKNPNICTDLDCYKQKETNLVKLAVGQHPKAELLSLGHHYNDKLKGLDMNGWSPAGKKSCPSTKEGIIVQWNGPTTWPEDKKDLRLGQVLQVCTNKKCEVHHPKAVRQSSTRQCSTSAKWDQEQKLKRQVRERALVQIIQNVKTRKGMTVEDLRLVANRILDGFVFGDQASAVAVIFGLKSHNRMDVKWVATLGRGDLEALLLGGALYDYWETEKEFAAIATAHKVDLAAIRKELTAATKKPAAAKVTKDVKATKPKAKKR